MTGSFAEYVISKHIVWRLRREPELQSGELCLSFKLGECLDVSFICISVDFVDIDLNWSEAFEFSRPNTILNQPVNVGRTALI